VSRRQVQGLLAAVLLLGPVPGRSLQARVGLEYDDNPFGASAGVSNGRRASWINRVYLTSSAPLFEAPWGWLQLRHQWGLKHFWRSEEKTQAWSEVMAAHLELEGGWPLFQRMVLLWNGEVKFKEVERISREKGYLQGALGATVKGRLGKGFTGRGHYQRVSEYAWERDLADVDMQAVGAELGYSRTRRLQAHLGVNWRWLGYGRPVLELGPDGKVRVGAGEQADRLREIVARAQFFEGMLVEVTYAWVDNHSNSLGYGFRAHRLQGLLSRPIAFGVDGQFFFNIQRRRYRETLIQALPVSGTEQDEYAHTLLFLELSRQLTERYGLAWQYHYLRNGSRYEGFYRKNTYGLSLNVSL